MKLLDGQTADGSGAWFTWPGGVGVFWVRYAAGTGTVTLEVSPGVTYSAAAAGDETTFTTDGQGVFELGGGMRVRATVSSASGINVDAGIAKLPRGR